MRAGFDIIDNGRYVDDSSSAAGGDITHKLTVGALALVYPLCF